jgi:murein DD-endopeptidase MepM/ murein hydrolase activator NlpD
MLLATIIIYSPINRFISKRSPEAKRLLIIEEKVKKLYSEMFRLTAYNNKLKYALGDTTVKDLENIDQNKFIEEKDNYLLKPEFTTSLNPDRSNGYNYFEVSKTIDMPFTTPVSNYIISQEFDDEQNHFGLDFAGKKGEAIIAAADGYVVFSNWTLDYGNTIIIMHGGRFLTKYKHNLCNLKQIGNFVRRGEIIAMLGNTGKLSSNPHLHFEIWKNGVAVNPLKYLLIRK